MPVVHVVRTFHAVARAGPPLRGRPKCSGEACRLSADPHLVRMGGFVDARPTDVVRLDQLQCPRIVRGDGIDEGHVNSVISKRFR